jgi:hypothetical protein
VNGGEWETTEKGKPPTGVRRQELVFIGPGLQTAELEQELDKCLLTDAEMEQQEEQSSQPAASSSQLDDGHGHGRDASEPSDSQDKQDQDNYARGRTHGHGTGGAVDGEDDTQDGQGTMPPNRWWRALKDEFPAFEIDCCVTDPDCEEHNAPPGAPRLRFKPGDRVQCNCEQWETGTVTGLFYREDSWPEGQYAPYQVRLDSGRMICAPADTDDCIKAAELRFKPGDRVLCNCGEQWKAGTITGLHYREDSWPAGEFAPYQVRLDSGKMICAPADNDGCIRAAEGSYPGASTGNTPSQREAPQLRFKPGDRVLCNCGERWEPGTITGLHYREDSWPAGEFAPYQVRLDIGDMICAPADTSDCIKAAAAAADGASADAKDARVSAGTNSQSTRPKESAGNKKKSQPSLRLRHCSGTLPDGTKCDVEYRTAYRGRGPLCDKCTELNHTKEA